MQLAGIGMIVVGLGFAGWMWARNGMAEKVLGWDQLHGWPWAGIGFAVVGVLLVVLD